MLVKKKLEEWKKNKKEHNSEPILSARERESLQKVYVLYNELKWWKEKTYFWAKKRRRGSSRFM
ncbi:hypothetical protein OVS_02165 [Mycoplasma ovis str. Michigan]|uniref:Transposase n=1 Tax=Mycoplasma ovis str. Michigan TaxID=1415773 RepID=A0ABM5P1Q7_9MOLU|nr:hypothetical protein OVS_02165 [Mycoplasma ovis str. Michigan]